MSGNWSEHGFSGPQRVGADALRAIADHYEGNLNGVAYADVVEVVAGGGDAVDPMTMVDAEFHFIARLHDGRFAWIATWHDYTGYG